MGRVVTRDRVWNTYHIAPWSERAAPRSQRIDPSSERIAPWSERNGASSEPWCVLNEASPVERRRRPRDPQRQRPPVTYRPLAPADPARGGRRALFPLQA